jgi:hypothetical protein
VAYLFRRSDGRVEVREALATPAGPRARTLATFRGALTPDVLERAGARARRPFDPERLRAHAERLGIAVTRRRGDRSARELLAHLRRGGSVDGVLAAVLRDALARVAGPRVPDELADVAEWVGEDDARRGEALRGLLRVADRVARSRSALRAEPRPVFPRFASARRARR